MLVPYKIEDIPYQNFIQSPIGLVPKAGNKTRLIFHLSFDFGEDEASKSMNHHTPKQICLVKYNDLDYAVQICMDMMKRKPDWIGRFFAGKTDPLSAFRNVPLRPDQFKWAMIMAIDPLTGKEVFFFDKCLPFGASISCTIFQKFSDALKFLVEASSKQTYVFVTNYLDDIYSLPIPRVNATKCCRNF